MPATLQQIQAKLAEAIALRDDAEENLNLLALTEGGLSLETRQKLNAKLNGYNREVEALMKCERELIANGRLSPEAARLIETAAPGLHQQCAEPRFNEGRTLGAVTTPPVCYDAQEAPREAPRSEEGDSSRQNHELVFASAPLPAAGDVF